MITVHLHPVPLVLHPPSSSHRGPSLILGPHDAGGSRDSESQPPPPPHRAFGLGTVSSQSSCSSHRCPAGEAWIYFNSPHQFHVAAVRTTSLLPHPTWCPNSNDPSTPLKPPSPLPLSPVVLSPLRLSNSSRSM